jgi:hypothetical protein
MACVEPPIIGPKIAQRPLAPHKKTLDANGKSAHTSLSILRPHLRTVDALAIVHDNPMSSYLGALTEALLNLLLSGQHEHPLLQTHISPAFELEQEDLPPTRGRDALILESKRLCTRFPDYHVEIHTARTKVSGNGRRAKVWLFKRLCGLVGGLCRESVGIMRLRRYGQTWVCVNLTMMKGVAEYA